MALASNQYRQDNQPVYVLHTYAFKETSLVAELFTKTHGRVATVAKGARRPRSAMRGQLQSFQKLSATWSGKNELKTLHSLDWADGLVLLQGEALMCGFYLNELLLRLLPREDAHEQLFDYYQTTLKALATSNQLATNLRRFELKMLQEMGYAVPLHVDEDDQPVVADSQYRYEAEYGACALTKTKNGIELSGQTLLDMAQDNYNRPQTQQQSKQLMRYLLAHYLGDKPLHTRQLLIDLQGL
jgi:DNA repair protein RecO (recombination protein O)